MIVDARIRPPFGDFTRLSIFDEAERSSLTASGLTAWPRSVLEQDFAAMLAEMDAAGIDRGVVPGRHAGSAYGSVDNEMLRTIRRRAPGRFWLLGGAGTGSSLEALAECRRCIEDYDFDGMVFDPGWLDRPRRSDDGFYYPSYAYCAERSVPVFITLGVFSGPDLTYSDPTAIQHVAQTFPSLDIVVTHACWPWTREIIGVMARHKNVWIMPDFYMNVPGMPGRLDYIEAANSFLGDRVLYGSGYPGRPLGESLEQVRRLALDPAAIERLCGANAARLFHRSPR
jgi:predicted TIM-barrel fold metal-dependent hydrolase